MLYVQIGFLYRDGCDPATSFIHAWSLDPARAAPEAAIGASSLIARAHAVVRPDRGTAR